MIIRTPNPIINPAATFTVSADDGDGGTGVSGVEIGGDGVSDDDVGGDVVVVVGVGDEGVVVVGGVEDGGVVVVGVPIVKLASEASEASVSARSVPSTRTRAMSVFTLGTFHVYAPSFVSFVAMVL